MCRRNHPDVTPHGRPQDTGTPMTTCTSSIKGTVTPHATPHRRARPVAR